jgi:hypothetical protein
LILWLNSAAESIYTKEMIDMYRDTTALRGSPHVIMISSEADMATGLAFPIGTKISNTPKLLTGTFRKYHDPDRKLRSSNTSRKQPDTTMPCRVIGWSWLRKAKQTSAPILST